MRASDVIFVLACFFFIAFVAYRAGLREGRRIRQKNKGTNTDLDDNSNAHGRLK